MPEGKGGREREREKERARERERTEQGGETEGEKEGTTTIIERYSNSNNKDRILPQPSPHAQITLPAHCSQHMMDPLHPSSTPPPPPCPINATLEPPPPPFLFAIPHPAPKPNTSRRIQCNPSFNLVLLYPVYVCYIVILFVTDEATIKAKRFICFLKESRVTLSFVVKSKLVTVLSLFLCDIHLFFFCSLLSSR